MAAGPARNKVLVSKTQTRRRLRARQPLWGIGVTSRIDVIANPTADSARRADSRPEPGPPDHDLEGLHAVLHRLLAGILGGDLRGKRRRLARTTEALGASRGPGNRVALGIGDGDHGVVERGAHMSDAGGNVLPLATAKAGS